MGPRNSKPRPAARGGFGFAMLLCCVAMHAQQSAAPSPPIQPAASAIPSAQQPSALPDAPSTASITGLVTDTDGALIPNAQITLHSSTTDLPPLTTQSGPDGSFTLSPVPPGVYRLRIGAPGFSPWTLHDIVVHVADTLTLPTVQLGVEAIDSAVDAITVEDLAEQQVTAEEHQRILGILPNFYVSYAPNPQPLTPKQKFKLALVITRDPITFGTTAIAAGIEQAEGSFRGYGPGFPGYAQRYAATYGDRLSSTFLGSAVLPSLLHQDPRYFYLGHGSVLHRTLYAVSTTVICKGDNGRWQPNYSNVFGNLGSAGISNLYYPGTARHSAQVTVDNSLIGIAEGSVSTLLQEFLLHRLNDKSLRRWHHPQ